MVPLVLTDEWRSAWRLNCQASLGARDAWQASDMAKSGQYCTDGRSGVNLDLDLLGVAQIPSNSGCR